MKFRVNRNTGNPVPDSITNDLISEIIKNGNMEVEDDEKSDFVVNLIDINNPRAYRRKEQEEKVISLSLLDENVSDIKSLCYVTLVRSLSNMLFAITRGKEADKQTGYSITPEVGFVRFPFSPAKMYYYFLPVVTSHFVLRNRIYVEPGLASAIRYPETDDLIKYAKELQTYGVLPAPFPLTQYLDQDLTDHLFRLYQIKGLSYGNLSIRNRSVPTEGTSYWMTARGVDKSNLQGPGHDILLVTGYDKTTGEMLVSVPPVYDTGKRVSVDAIEHYLIYNEFPDIGAVVHVHAWIENVMCTTQTCPCGTKELAENVVEMLRLTPDPGRAEVGLKNHGITVTGPDIGDIFSRLKGRLITNVPMFT